MPRVENAKPTHDNGGTGEGCVTRERMVVTNLYPIFATCTEAALVACCKVNTRDPIPKAQTHVTNKLTTAVMDML